MYQKWTQLALAIALIVALGLIGFLVMRISSPPAAAPTADVGSIQTRAVAAFASDLTGTVAAQPSGSTATATKAATQGSTAVAAATDATASVSPTASCYRLKFVDDVTVEDYTIMTPAQVFTKTWRAENSGSCPWRPGFKMVLIGGSAMGGSPFVVNATVNPGGRLDISIKMVAPTNQTGRIEGTWQMSDEAGVRFGDPLTVIIVVGNTGGGTATAQATATP